MDTRFYIAHDFNQPDFIPAPAPVSVETVTRDIMLNRPSRNPIEVEED